MHKTTFTCDRCGKSWPVVYPSCDKPQRWTVGIVADCPPITASPACVPRKKAEWCRECVEKLGLLPPKKDADGFTPEGKPVEIEDIIREIVREEMENE